MCTVHLADEEDEKQSLFLSNSLDPSDTGVLDEHLIRKTPGSCKERCYSRGFWAGEQQVTAAIGGL